MEDAGGIGGLLLVTYHTSPAISAFAGYDGNGNVTVLVDADALFATARYEYSPFGETLRATGPLAKINPFRFSTKFADDESGLLNYGYRYYSPGLGRWVGRDPIEEVGGVNLYGFCENGPLGRYDRDGRNPLLLAAAAVVLEVAFMAYDVYDAMDTITDPESDSTDILLSLGGVAAGGILPFGGYGKVSKGTRHVINEYMHAFDRHGKAWGFDGTATTENLLKFRRAISEHRKAKNTMKISGKWKRGGVRDADFYLDPQTGLLAVYDKQGNLITALKASDEQISNILTEGVLW